MNAEFQEAKRQYSIALSKDEKAKAIDKMRKNLIERNSGEINYTFSYTLRGKVVNIRECDIKGLYEVDGDMNPCML